MSINATSNRDNPSIDRNSTIAEGQSISSLQKAKSRAVEIVDGSCTSQVSSGSLGPAKLASPKPLKNSASDAVCELIKCILSDNKLVADSAIKQIQSGVSLEVALQQAAIAVTQQEQSDQNAANNDSAPPAPEHWYDIGQDLDDAWYYSKKGVEDALNWLSSTTLGHITEFVAVVGVVVLTDGAAAEELADVAEDDISDDVLSSERPDPGNTEVSTDSEIEMQDFSVKADAESENTATLQTNEDSLSEEQKTGQNVSEEDLSAKEKSAQAEESDEFEEEDNPSNSSRTNQGKNVEIEMQDFNADDDTGPSEESRRAQRENTRSKVQNFKSKLNRILTGYCGVSSVASGLCQLIQGSNEYSEGSFQEKMATLKEVESVLDAKAKLLASLISNKEDTLKSMIQQSTQAASQGAQIITSQSKMAASISSKI